MGGTDLPVIDVGPLVAGAGSSPEAVAAVAAQLDRACRDDGFFSIVGHGVDPALRADLDRLSRAFFALDDAEKARVAMDRGGRAWRGWFPVGGELTSGVPDGKEGLYLGAELGPEDPRVGRGVPLHGPNLFPERPPGLRATVLAYLEAMTRLGHALVGGLGLALGLDREWFDRHLTGDPLVLLRIFRYPPATGPSGSSSGHRWGVGEHTDYGLLTILGQDGTGGLQVHGRRGWIDVAPRPDAFVCNLGDMLERMTGGRYRSTPHRVRATPADRLSFPFFFDPAWDAVVPSVTPAAGRSSSAEDRRRWDGTSVHAFEGTYGDYLTVKLARVFPELGTAVLGPDPAGD
jgi:isopenicillin N synthase-like dioxygenase